MKPLVITSPDALGFRGCFYLPRGGSDRCILVLAGDRGKDFLDQAFARWLTKVQGISCLCLDLPQWEGDTGVHEWPLETVEAAVSWLRHRGIPRIGILGMSMQAVIALAAAQRIPELSLVLAFSPCDFVPWGFTQEKGKEQPTGTSLLTWRGQPLPWQPAGLDPEAYWQLFLEEKKEFRELHTITIFNHSEQVSPIPPEAFLAPEEIRGKLVLIGSEDDSMWHTARYLRRMASRLRDAGKEAEILLYPFGTHFLLPLSLLQGALPGIWSVTLRLFASGRSYPGQCRSACQDLDRKLSSILSSWK